MGKLNTGLRIGIALAILPMLILGASGKKQRIDSRWKDRDITIDGDNGEWPGPLVPVDEHQRLDAAAANDGQFLYLVLSTSDATLRAQIMGQGLIVWFDPGGGDRKAFGIKFPVGMASGDMPGRGRGFHRPDPSGSGSGQGDSSGRAVTLEPPNRLEIFGPDKDDAHSFVADKAPGSLGQGGAGRGCARLRAEGAARAHRRAAVCHRRKERRADWSRVRDAQSRTSRRARGARHGWVRRWRRWRRRHGRTRWHGARRRRRRGPGRGRNGSRLLGTAEAAEGVGGASVVHGSLTPVR